MEGQVGDNYVEFLESDCKPIHTSIDLLLVEIREDYNEQPILILNFGEVGDNCFQSAEKWNHRSANVCSLGCN